MATKVLLELPAPNMKMGMYIVRRICSKYKLKEQGTGWQISGTDGKLHVYIQYFQGDNSTVQKVVLEEIVEISDSQLETFINSLFPESAFPHE
jgi:hypothetical protein